MFSAAIALQLRGVGHNPDSISSVRGVDGASWNNKWDGLVAEVFQIRKAALEAHWLVNKASHILANEIFRSQLCNKASHFRPEITVIFCASLLPGL
jgi:hypothetical protein